MVCKDVGIFEQLPPESEFSQKSTVVTTGPHLELIRVSLESADDRLASGIGESCMKDDRKRKGRDPDTFRDAILPARRVVTFKRSGKLRKKANEEQ